MTLEKLAFRIGSGSVLWRKPKVSMAYKTAEGRKDVLRTLFWKRKSRVKEVNRRITQASMAFVN